MARLVIGWASTNKASRHPVLLKHGIVSPTSAGQPRLIVATDSNHGPASKRAKVGWAFRQIVCEQTSKVPAGRCPAGNRLRAKRAKRAKSPGYPLLVCSQSDRGIGSDWLTLCSLCSQHFGAMANGRAMDHLLRPPNLMGLASHSVG